jgi:hypothetical protein
VVAGPVRGDGRVVPAVELTITAAIIGRKARPVLTGEKRRDCCRQSVRNRKTPKIPVVETPRARNEPPRFRSRTIRSGNRGCGPLR